MYERGIAFVALRSSSVIFPSLLVSVLSLGGDSVSVIFSTNSSAASVTFCNVLVSESEDI